MLDEAVASVSQLSPAAVIIGLPTKRGCGIDATRRLSTVAPTTPVMLLADSAGTRGRDQRDSRRSRGYMLKGAPKEAIAGAVQAVAAGDSVVSSKVAEHLLEGIRSGAFANGRAPRAEAGDEADGARARGA